MELQSFTKKEAINIMKLAIAEEQRKMCRAEDTYYYAFPRDFPTTHGPFAKPGSIGGSSVTTYIIEVWHNRKFDVAVFFCGDTPLAMVPDFSVKNIETDYTKNNILIAE